MIAIRCGSGLGDALYLRPFVDHLSEQGKQLEVCTDYPDVFTGCPVKLSPFRRDRINKVCHYIAGKARTDTSQWQDLCISAQIEVPLSFHWDVRKPMIVHDLKAMARGKPIVMVNGGRPPMGRTDAFVRDFLPKRRAFDAVLGALSDCFIVEVGKGAELYPISADVDFADRTSVADLLDIATAADGLIGQCSFMIPLAEAFDKPLLTIWAAAGLRSGVQFIRQCTPQKILSKPTSRWVLDDWSEAELIDSARYFRGMMCK